MTLHSTINNYGYYDSDRHDAESDPKSDQLVATHNNDAKKRKLNDTDTTNTNYRQKLLINQTIPVIILPNDPPIVDGVAASRWTFHVRQTIALKEIVTNAACSGARVLSYTVVINQKYTNRKIPRDGKTSRSPPRLTTPLRIGGGPSISPTRTGNQDIGSPSESIGPVKVRNAQPLHTSINGISSKHRYPAPTSSKVIGCKLSDESSANI